ncbi:spore germination protein [Paenibacillus mendelii]|uniref:Spore germination protein n=1 Tax=Paenibacillus mendelii TaxID=206163 RepID=A0ABV6J296_9BACL|nr:spore germination protein [Paenibacillus mendelii]MCQ6562798.1 spore germination protein [Paenibacillus mendelii]
MKTIVSAASAQKAKVKPEIPTLTHILSEFNDCVDLVHRYYPEVNVHLVYFDHQVDHDKLYREVMNPLIHVHAEEEVPKLLEQSQFTLVRDSKELVEGILSGRVAIFSNSKTYLVDVFGLQSRSVSQSESETVITGPHDAFTEQAGINLSLIRQRIKSSHLKVIKLSVGEVTKTDVYILYIKDIANMTYVNEAIRRISNIEIDAVFDTNMLLQFIDDAPFSIFPQFLTSERPEAIASKLVAGRIVGIVDGSPSALSAPTSFFEYFSSSDDYNQRWMLGSASRLLRFLALFITLSFTSLYVSVTTFHYEMIPENLLITLTESRSKVPFPPLFEALFMEVTIELLREAGARLPSKIGQTIGIVGGIVIGQAAVQAGLTSNILIIAVASSAIASFVTPAYVMSASIRFLRFGLIILAGVWGNFGLAVGISAIVIHLSGLTSLGSSYLTPIAPFKPRDWKDVFIIAPFKYITERPSQSKSPNTVKNKMRK